MKDAYRVMIAEDHAVVRQSLGFMISRTFENLEVVAEAEDGLTAVKQVRKFRPDVLFLDISMPRLNGLSVIDAVKHIAPDIKIIVLTINSGDEWIKTAFEYGADAYCLKAAPFEELAMAIRMVLDGKRFISPEIAGGVMRGYLHSAAVKQDASARTEWDDISQREREILKMVGEGYKNREIADYLCISIKTVEKHRSNIMKKLNLHTSSALAAYAAKKGIVTFN